MINLHSQLPSPQSTRIRLAAVRDWDTLLAQADYNIPRLAALCGYSVRTLERFTMQQFQVSLLHFIKEKRLQQAHQLLQRSGMVKEVAMELGYKQASHFSRQFRQRFGLAPGEVARRAETEATDGIPEGPVTPPKRSRRSAGRGEEPLL
jgi:AraC-like DNA-binding protein